MKMKDYREKELKWYIIAYLLLLIGIRNFESMPTDNTAWLNGIESLLSSALLGGVVCVLSFVFDCLYTSEEKEFLLFLRFTTMPGKTIFTRIAQGKAKDIRFENSTAQERYQEIIGNLPPDKKEKRNYENAKWYALSLEHEENPRVSNAHRDFLLCRDLYITTITMLILTGAGMFAKIIQFDWIPIIYLAALLLLTNLAAHAKAHRFVNSVIAVDLSKK